MGCGRSTLGPWPCPPPLVYPLARQGETGLGGGNSRSLFTYLMFGALQSKILLNECATCEQREVSVAMQGRLGCQCGSEHPGMQTFCLYPDNLRPSLHPETPPGPLPQVSHPGPPHSRTNSTLTCPLPHALLFMATPAPASCTSVRRGPCSASTHDCWAADSWRVESPSATEPQPALGRSHSVAYWVLSWVPFLMFRVTRSRVWMNP